MQARRDPIGVILAGGLGRRIGGGKATVQVRGRPLISYPLAAARAALGEVAVLAKADTELPSLPGATVWIEPEGEHHPLVGIRHALALAEGRPVVICAVDLPLLTPELVGRVASAEPLDAPAAVACVAGQLQPLLGRYQSRAQELFGPSGAAPGVPLRKAICALRPVLVEVEDPDELFNVNYPEDVIQAAAMLRSRDRGVRGA